MITVTFTKYYLLIYLQGAEPCMLSWTKQSNQRKAPKKRKMDKSTVGVAASALQFGSCSVFPSIDASTDAAHSFSECDENAAEVECESPQTEPDCVLELQRRIELLETQLADCQEKLSEAEKENAVLLERQFSIDKIKDDNAAVLFYTGFPSYEALISFYKYIEPKLSKMLLEG